MSRTARGGREVRHVRHTAWESIAASRSSWTVESGAVGALLGPFLAGQLADRSIATEKLLAASHAAGAILVYFLSVADTFPLFVSLSFVYGLVYAPTLALTN